MNIPAVPEYVLTAAGGFDGCPPGHRFNLYFPIWRESWQIDKNGKAGALGEALKLGAAKAALDAILQRQNTLAEGLPAEQCYIMEARSTAPFATGLGLEHPIENGFAFLSPYGLPYLAGSGVKGVLRSAAKELEQEGSLPKGTVFALFGPDTDEIKKPEDARRGALTCWDVFPMPPNDELVVEIMTPHFGHYYQPEKGKEHLATPHDAGKPNPIPFLAVPASSKFRFVVTCAPSLLSDAVPENDWKACIEAIFKRAFDWLGFGAKTAVGYGAMEEDPAVKARREQEAREAEEQRLREQAEADRQKELSRMTPAERAMREFLDARQDKNQPELNALIGALKAGEWSGELKTEIAGHVKTMMEKTGKWKENSQAKRPEKDKDYQNTLLVMRLLEGE